MRVLLLGGTGAMGIHLQQLLLEKEFKVYVTSRKKDISKKGINFLLGNAMDYEFLKSTLEQKWDVIVDFMIYSSKVFSERVDLLCSSTYQYIYLSSGRVYADSDNPILENTPRLLDTSTDQIFLNTDEYSLLKAKQENILIKSGYRNWTIIRPYITYAENRFQLGVMEKEEWLFRALKGKTIIMSKDIYGKTTTLTYGCDVARGIMELMGRAEVLGETFHITGKSTTWAAILKVYTDVLENYTGKRIKVLFQDLNKTLENRPIYQILYDRLYDRTFDNKKINKYVNTNEFVKVEDGLERTLVKFLETPQFKEINWRLEAFKDKETGEMSNLNTVIGFKNKLRYIYYRFIKTH